MTVAALMEMADSLASNVLPMKVKLFELNRLEQRICVDALGQDPQEFSPYNEEEQDVELALEDRFQDVYVYWLSAMIFFHQRETEDYENQRAMFQEAWTRFERELCTQIDRETAAGSAADAGVTDSSWGAE